ncbi:hypothetical protein SAMD00024442_33_21 [Candidatus Symbiothrix dinenymphae]|nr:hypothetical protein SAMD00024442_33_21 [Candidatus Symbiothrix dinenymphae]
MNKNYMVMNKLRRLLVVCLLCVGTTLQATVWYVKPGGSGDGTSWGSAMGALQLAINAASDGDEIWVASGTYKPTQQAGGSGSPRDVAFVLKSGVKIYGGWKGDEPDTSNPTTDRDLKNNITTLSGDMGGNKSTSSAHHVVIAAVVGDARLDGFTITGGYANEDAATITVNGKTIRKDCGGGVYIISSVITLANLIIGDNKTSVFGAGVYDEAATATLKNVTIRDNEAIGVTSHGGGFYSNGSSPVFVNVAIIDNSAGRGGGFYSYGMSHPVFVNVTISGNGATDTDISGGGGVFIEDMGRLEYYNTIIWGNSDGNVIEAPGDPEISSKYQNCLVEDLNPTGADDLGGNLDGTNPANDPLFTDPAIDPQFTGKYHLGMGSLAMEAGDNALYVDKSNGHGKHTTTEEDLAGGLRFVCDIDMGAYEGNFELTTPYLNAGMYKAYYVERLTIVPNRPVEWDVVDGGLPIGLALDGDSIFGTPTEEGTFTFKVRARCAPVEKEFTIFIEKRPATVEWGETEFVYTAEPLLPDAEIPGYAGDELVFTVTGEETNVGEYTATATLAENPPSKNYFLTNPTTPFKITPAPLEVDWSNMDFIYDGTPHKPDAEATGLGSDGKFSLSVSGAQTEAGTSYPAQATLADIIPETNYTLNNPETTFVIAPDTVTVKPVAQSKIYGDRDPKLTYTFVPDPLIAGNSFNTDSLVRDGGENVGKYAITRGDLSAGNNYFVKFVEDTLTITPKSIADLSITVDAIANQTYIGDSIKFAQVVVKDGAKTLVNGTDYTLSYANNRNRGTATITITGQNNYKDHRTQNFTIIPAEVSVQWSNTELTYKDSLQAPTATVHGVGTEATTTLALMPVGGEQIDAADTSYTATVALKLPDSTNENYTLQNTTTAFKINPAPRAVTWNDTIFNYLKDVSQLPRAEATALDKTTLLALTVEGAQTAVGNYTATAKLNSSNFNKNYRLTNTTFQFEIEPEAAKVVWNADTLFNYDGALHSPNALVTSADGSIELNFTITGKQINAGTYTATAALDDDPINTNYRIRAVDRTKAFTIKPVPALVGWGDTALIYNGYEQVPTATAKGIDSDGWLALTILGKKQTAGNGYTAKAILGSPNYILNNDTTIFSIAPDTVPVMWENIALVYTSLPQKPIASIRGNDADGKLFCDVAGAASEVNIYTAIATLNNNNYILTKDTTLFKIAREVVKFNVEWGDTLLFYNGEWQAPTATGKNQEKGLSLPLIVSGEQIKAGSHNAVADLDEDVKKDLNRAYTLIGEQSHGFTIAKKPVPVVWTDLEVSYDGAPHKPTATADALKLTVTVDAVDAGDYSATAELVNDDININYELTDTITSFTIMPALVPVEWRDTTLTYTGAWQAPTAAITGKGADGKIGLEVSGEQKDVGSGYPATATLVDNTNYTLDGDEHSFEITPYEADVIWDDTTKLIYNGTLQAPTAMIKGVGEDTIPIPLTVSGEQKDVDTDGYIATADLESNTNYTLSEDTKTSIFSIYPYEVEVEWGDTQLTYTAKPQAPQATITGLGEDGIIELVVSGSLTNIGSGTANASLGDNKNYLLSEESKTSTFKIVPDTVPVQWGNRALTWDGGQAQRPTATASGIDSVNLPLLPIARIGAGDGISVGAYTAVATLDSDSSVNSNYVLTNDTTTYTIKYTQFIRWTQELDSTFGARHITLTAVAVDINGDTIIELPVSYTSDSPDVAVIYGDGINTRKVGSATITPWQDGNAQYNAVMGDSKVITVIPNESWVVSDEKIVDEVDTALYAVANYYTDAQEVAIIRVAHKDSLARLWYDGKWLAANDEIPVDVSEWRPGIYPVSYTVKTEFMEDTTYTFLLEKRFQFRDTAVISVKYNNTLIVNNDSKYNYDYTFIEYQWYTDSVSTANSAVDTVRWELISDRQIYSVGENGEMLDTCALYKVTLTAKDNKDAEGKPQILHIAPGKVILNDAFLEKMRKARTLGVYPNPVVRGAKINLKDVPDSAAVQVYDGDGKKVDETTAGALHAPGTTGVFVVRAGNAAVPVMVQ